jgi:hypothetical protein
MPRIIPKPAGRAAIDASRFNLPSPLPAPGKHPELRWIPISDLVVDNDYQRPISGAGTSNVRKIAANFKWSCFAPVVVAQVGAKFAIVDGQHRTTAAALIGIEEVPCMVISATPCEQALAFKEINGATTKMSRQAIHSASVAAGDKDAHELEDVARRAGVTILRYPVAMSLQNEGGQTMAVGCLAQCLRQHGRDTLITALQCVTQTENNAPGLLVASVIKALCLVIGDNPVWLQSGAKLLAAFDEVDIEGQLDRARTMPKPKGQTATGALAGLLRADLEAVFKAAVAA